MFLKYIVKVDAGGIGPPPTVYKTAAFPLSYRGVRDSGIEPLCLMRAFNGL